MKNKRKTAKIREIVLNLDHGAIIPKEVQGKLCPTLIDTGATRSCVSEYFFNGLQNTEIKEIYGLRIVCASGEDIMLKGLTTLQVVINNIEFSHTFLICRNITKPLVLGLDFLKKYRIGTTWTENGNFSLKYENKILIQSIEESFEERNPQLKAKSCIEIPGKSMVVVHARVNISPEQCDRLFDIVPTNEMLTTYPEFVTVPVVHRTSQKTYNTVPQVLVNLREEMVFIPKGTILAELQLMSCSINQITTESYIQMNEIEAQKALSTNDQNKPTGGDNDKSEVSKDDMEKLEKKFIT